MILGRSHYRRLHCGDDRLEVDILDLNGLCESTLDIL
jgi:hypothetical protein